MTRRPWRLHAARATLSSPHLFVLPSLNKSNPCAAQNLALLTDSCPQILLESPKKAAKTVARKPAKKDAKKAA